MSNEVRQFYEMVAGAYAGPKVRLCYIEDETWCKECQAEQPHMLVYERGVVIKRVCVMCGREARSEDHED
jgi:Zn ribbon nucleic-acid-binding protein